MRRQSNDAPAEGDEGTENHCTSVPHSVREQRWRCGRGGERKPKMMNRASRRGFCRRASVSCAPFEPQNNSSHLFTLGECPFKSQPAAELAPEAQCGGPRAPLSLLAMRHFPASARILDRNLGLKPTRVPKRPHDELRTLARHRSSRRLKVGTGRARGEAGSGKRPVTVERSAEQK
jgi:hypothetical protein